MDEQEDGPLPLQPVHGDERLVSLDFIRGVSVLGILFANIVAFGHPGLAYYWPGALPGGGTAMDGYVWLFQFVTVDGKFRGLFTVLFGAGLYLFMERQEARGGSPMLQVRRLLWLALFGFAHFAFLFVGDILLLYAISGLVALAMLHWSARTQLVAGLIWFLAGSAAFSLLYIDTVLIEGAAGLVSSADQSALRQAWESHLAESAQELRAMSEGSYTDIVRYRLTEQIGNLIHLIHLAAFKTIPLILVGMGLYRFGLLGAGEGVALPMEREKLRRWGWAGIISGALGSLALGLWVVAEHFPPYLTQAVFIEFSSFPGLAMILGLAVVLSLGAKRAAQTWLGVRLVAAGRMAFSNYILTSVVMMLVFHGWAGGHFGQMHRLELLLPVLLGWAIMIAWSRPWLARFRYGPLEWLWRCLTYRKFFPLRR